MEAGQTCIFLSIKQIPAALDFTFYGTYHQGNLEEVPKKYYKFPSQFDGNIFTKIAS